MKTKADSSSLELPNEWQLLLPAAGTKAPLSHSSETQPNFPDMQGCPAQVWDTTDSTNGKILEGTCVLINVAQNSKSLVKYLSRFF